MFDVSDSLLTDNDQLPASPRLSTADLVRLVAALAGLEERVEDAERVDQIRLLEELKGAAAAAQARVTAAFVASQRAAQVEAGVPAKRVGVGVAAQVGLAKRESPARAARYVGWAGVLVGELPATFAALQAGRITEWRAQIVARETGWLSREHRARVDTALGPRLQALGDRQVEAEAKRVAYRLDPHGYLARIASAQADRRVTLRPAPDTMSVLTGLLPVPAGVAVHASLTSQADTLRAAGDSRSRGQIMADTLVERVTGHSTATAVPIGINLIMTDTTLFNTSTHTGSGSTRGRYRVDAGTTSDADTDTDTDTDMKGAGTEVAASAGTGAEAGSDEPALLEGYGPIPAELARRLIHTAEDKAMVWLRRLYTCPNTGQLVAMDSTRRHFPSRLRQLLVLRDQTCRTPWCDAPIRHTDHVTPAVAGGATSIHNGQGLCQACNHNKQAPGWTARPTPETGGAGTAVHITTPTAHAYTSRPPAPPGQTAPPPPPPTRRRPQRQSSATEDHLRRLILAA